MRKILVYLILQLSISISFVFSQTSDFYLENGDMYHKKFENVAALKEYEKAYELDPQSFLILKRLTLSSNDCGEDLRDTDMEKAKLYFRQSIRYAEITKEKFPNEPEVYFLLAISYGNLARYSNGKEKVKLARNVEENLKLAIKYNPDFAPPYIALGIYYREVAKLGWFLKSFAKTFMGGLSDGTLEESKLMLLKALQIKPDFIITHYEIAKTYSDLEEYDKARYHLQKVMELEVQDHGDRRKKEKVEKILSENDNVPGSN